MATITMYNSINIDDAFSPVFAAVGYGVTNAVYTADTTGAWTAATLPAASNWNSVCYGNKLIVAIAAGTRNTATTPTGVTWTARSNALPTAVTWQSIIYGTRFVAIANGSTDNAYSTDGITWSSGGAMPSAAAWYCLAYGEGTYVAVSTTSSSAVAYSTDAGANWNSGTGMAAGNWQSVAYGNGTFVAVSYNSTAGAYSADGISWSASTLPSTQNWSSVAWGNPMGTANGVFVAVAYGSAVGAVSTDNGQTWTQVPLAPDVVVNGSFTGSADGWTLTSGWSYADNKITHAASGGTTTVVPATALTIAAGLFYEVTYTVSGRTAGSVTAQIGGTNGTTQSTNATFVQVITAAGTGNLTFTPTTDFDGSIDDVSVRFAHNWNCISYGTISSQGVRVFTVTAYGTTTGMAVTTVSFDGLDWFLKTITTASNWKYHCFAPVTWNSGDTLSVQNNATITVNTNQTKFWKTFTATYGTFAIQNTSTSVPIGFYMGRVSAATANDITPLSGAFSIDIDGNWIELGTGSGAAGQTFTASFNEYIPSLWIETGSGTGVYEIWNNVTGAVGNYMNMFGKDGLQWAGSGKRGNYFVQTPATNPTEIKSLTSGVTTIQSYYVTCADTTGVFAGATITGTNIPANTVINRVVDGTTLELNVVTTATGSGYTFTVYNPYQSQWTTTLTVGDGTNGNVVPSGAKVRIPNIMFSDLTAGNLISASHLVDAYINMANGGVIDARTCLFGRTYVNFAQAASVYLRNVGFAYQWALSECYAVDMDGVGNAASPMVWYYSTEWRIRDPRYGILPPFGYTASTASCNVLLSYIHNAVIKNWHKVVYCTAYFTGTAILMPIDLSYTDDAVFENIRSVVLMPHRAIRCFNISNRVYRSTFTNLELYGANPLQVITSDNNTFSGIEYSLSLFKPIKAFKTAMRLSQNAAGTLLSDNVPVYIKTRTFFSWASRDIYFESGEYSATPFQNNWLFPNLISVRPTESVPASVTFNWTQREPTAASVLAYEVHRSTSEGFTTRDTSTAVFRGYVPATVAFVNGPRTTVVAGAPNLTFNVAKTITAASSIWLTNGFAVGDVVEVTGTTANNGTYTINTLTTTVMTVNETLVTETTYTSGATVTGRAPTVDTKYYYRMRKCHTVTAHVDCSVQSGSTTMTCSNVNTNWGFDKLYAATDFYFESGVNKIRNRKYVLFNTPFYVGATITGTGIPAATTITSIDPDSQTIGISNNTTMAAENVTITLPVQAGMAVNWLINRPTAGIPYGTTVASVESATSLTLSNAATADIAYVTNGTFTGSATGWTLGSGWSYGSNAVSHTSGTATMTQTSMNVVIGGVYTVTYTISGMSAGTVTVSIGGAAGTARSTNGTYIQALTATTTGTLTFTPTTTFNGTIDDVYVGVTLSFLPFTESPEFAVTPHDYTSATNLCLQSRTLATTWVSSGVTATNADTYQAPSELTYATPGTSTRLVSSSSPGTVTQTITGLTIGQYYSAAIWIRANQTLALPNGVAGNFTWAGTSTAFTANYKWQRIKVENVQASATSHTIVISITTTGQTMWATDAMVNVGTTVNTGNIVTTTAAVTLKPPAIPITTLYSYNRPSLMCGSAGHQGIAVTFGTAPTGSYYHEVYLSTTSGFTPSDATLVASTFAGHDSTPFPITGSNYNNFSDITKLDYGGCSTAATTGIFYLTASSSNNAIVNVDIDYTYQNTTAIPALHLTSPAQNNVFHNIDFGRVNNYLAASSLWYSTAVNSVTGNRVQNIFAKHRDIGFNDQTLASKMKGIACSSSFPVAAGTTYLLGTSAIDDSSLARAQAYGSMFVEQYFGNGLGAIMIVFEDTQGVKPYTTTGTPRFSNTGLLYLPTVSDTITITWPWKIKGVTGFQNVMRRLNGANFGNNNTILDGLKLEYKINNEATWKRLKGVNLAAEGALDATNGFDFQVRLTPFVFMKFSTQPTGTMTTYTVANPGVITINATGWATGQKVLYTTTGDAFGGLTNGTEYYLIMVSTTTFQLSLTVGGAGIALTSATGSGVHTFNVLFQVGETILGATSFATAVVDEVYYDTITTGTLVLSSVDGSWVAGENIRTSDNRATKALNVATNGFALGPSYTSYVNAIQLMTTVDETKLYDAAIVTVTLTNIVPDSVYYIFDSNTNTQIATGTATGTPAGGETTINYHVSVVYEADFDITVNVRKSSAPVKYLPYETGSTVTSSGANVFIAQVVDTVVIDSYGSIASDWTVNVTLKTIKHTSGTTVYPVNSLYSWLLDYFDNAGYLDDEVPMSASTPVEYNLINGWFIDDPSFAFLTGGSVTSIGHVNEIQVLRLDGILADPTSGDIGKPVLDDGVAMGALLAYEVDSYGADTGKWWVRTGTGIAIADNSVMTITGGIGAGTASSASLDGECVWSNIFTLGSLVAGTVLDVYQNDTQITPWWDNGAVHIDILVKVKEAGVEIDSGNVTVIARKYGTLYDHFVIDASSGRNPVPLAAFTDGNNTTDSATVGAYAGITFDFGYASKNLSNGNGAQPYDVIVECNNHTLLEIYEYLKYVTRTGSSTTLNSVNGEYYTGCGDVRFAYNNESVGAFVEGELITGTGGAYGYLVSLLDSGTTGTMVLRNVHGTFTNTMIITGATNGATANVNGSVTTITPQKQAPFGTYAGGTFFGARGVWLDHVAGADANNYQLVDSLGVTQQPPASIAITVTGLVEGDKVAMFRTTGDNETLNKTMYTSDASANTTTNLAFVVTSAIESDTPATGKIRVVDRDASGNILGEQTYAYSGWSGTTFTLTEALTATYNGDDTVYVPYLDTTVPALADSVSVSVSYVSDRYVVTRVRHKGIVPFAVKGQVKSTGLSVTAIRTEDTIVT